MANWSNLQVHNHLSEFTEPIVDDRTGVGVVTAAARQAAAVANIGLAASIADLDTVDGQATAPLSVGAGANSCETYASCVERAGGLIHTSLVIDITGLVSAATTDLDIIGDASAAASANIGEIDTAVMGTLVAGRMTCLEAPDAGVCDDIDLYSATVGTGAAQSAIGDLTETALVTSGAVWTNGRSLGMIALPGDGAFLYLTNGASDTGGTYTTGKFLIEFWGTPA